MPYKEVEKIVFGVIDKVRNECKSHDEEWLAKKEAVVLIDEFYQKKLDEAYEKGQSDSFHSSDPNQLTIH